MQYLHNFAVARCRRVRLTRSLTMPARRKNSQRGLNQGGGPGRGRGRLQLAAQRQFYGREVISTAEVAQAAFVRWLLLHGRRLRPDHYRQIRRVLAAIADPVGRAGGRGRPTIWRFKDSSSSSKLSNSSGLEGED